MAESSGASVTAVAVPAASVPPSPQFWCHVCAASVTTVIDVDSAEVCCRECGGNFVEEVDPEDPPQGFAVQEGESPSEPQAVPVAATASANTQTATGGDGDRDRDRDGDGDRDGGVFSPFARDAADGLDAAFRARRSRARRYFRRGTAEDNDDELSMPPADLLHFLSGSLARGDQTFGGRPVEVFVGEGDGDGSGLLNALGGIFGLTSPMLASNPGDYAFGNMATVINQLMQNDPNRHGAPPASKEVVEHLPKRKIAQSDVDASAECPVCKDLFAVDEEVHKLPCEHLFHPDCILPWLKQHNSCPVCRFELPTDDPDYERRRQHSATAS